MSKIVADKWLDDRVKDTTINGILEFSVLKNDGKDVFIKGINILIDELEKSKKVAECYDAMLNAK